jgi:hypothetical protein
MKNYIHDLGELLITLISGYAVTYVLNVLTEKADPGNMGNIPFWAFFLMFFVISKTNAIMRALKLQDAL